MVCITPGDLQEREAVQGSKGRPPLGGVWGKEAWEASRDHLFPFPGVGGGRRGLLNHPEAGGDNTCRMPFPANLLPELSRGHGLSRESSKKLCIKGMHR